MVASLRVGRRAVCSTRAYFARFQDILDGADCDCNGPSSECHETKHRATSRGLSAKNLELAAPISQMRFLVRSVGQTTGSNAKQSIYK